MRDKGYDFIRAFSTILILTFHFYTTMCEMSLEIPSIIHKTIGRGSLCFGSVGVALFFILSGALKWNNYRLSFSTLKFYKKRFLKLCIPLYIGFIGAILVSYIVFPDKVLVSNKNGYIGIIISFLGLNFDGSLWGKFGLSPIWIIGEWFTSVILVIYILFPVFRWVFKNHRIIGTILIAILYIVDFKYQILTNSNGWFSFTYGFMCFWIGMLFEEYKNELTIPLIIIDSVIVVIYYKINPSNIFGINTLACLIFSILLFALLYQARIEIKFTKYVTKYSYEIYLVHHRIFLLIMPFWLSNESNKIQILLLFFVLVGLTFLVAEALSRASNGVINLSNC